MTVGQLLAQDGGSTEPRVPPIIRVRGAGSEVVEYNPFSYEIHENPYPTCELLRKSAPAYYNAEHDFWALSRFDDVWNAFADWQTFSSAGGVSLEDTAAL